MVSAIITAASLCDSSIREYRRSPSRNCSPSRTPRCTFGAAAALADAVATVCSCPFSSARMHVMIFVVLAIAIGSVSRFPNSTRPVSPSIRHAAVANSCSSSKTVFSLSANNVAYFFPKTEAGFPGKNLSCFFFFCSKSDPPCVFSL